MPQFDAANALPYGSFEKGIDLDAPRTKIPDGSYEDALNMLLSSDISGQHIASMKKDVKLDTLITWPTGNLYWFAPFTYSTYDAVQGILSFATHLLLLHSDGVYWRYDAGAPGTTTLVRRTGKAAAQLTTHFVYDQWLLTLNGRDAPLKYGQHFRFDSQGHEVPYLFPLGSKPVSPLVPSITGETWTFSSTGSFVADASVPGGGARVGTHSLVVKPGETATLTFTAQASSPTQYKNFIQGPRPYGGTDFAQTDYLAFQYYKASNNGGTPSIVVVFTNNDATHTDFTVTTPTVGSWKQNTVLLSTGTSTAFAPTMGLNVKTVKITNNDTTADLYVDDMYLLYANAPPAGQVGTAHKDRIVLGGAPVAGSNSDPTLSTLFYSPASKPDEFPSTNTHLISGGAQSLSLTNRVTALREYGDAVIVGTQNAIFAWTVGTDGAPSRTVITTETGMDSPRAIVETPQGSLIFPWQRGFYILRQTGRQYASEKIAPLLNNIWLNVPWWTIGVRDEKTRTVRFWFRTLDPESEDPDPSATTTGVVFDYVRAQALGASVWPSRMGQLADYAVEAYIDGIRETLYCKFAGADIYRMHTDAGGSIESSVTLPWIETQDKEKTQLSRWVGLSVPYRATATVRVFIRYANHPHEFVTAEYEELQALKAEPTISDTARVFFGKMSRWVQVKFQAQDYGFEIYPPVQMITSPSSKSE